MKNVFFLMTAICASSVLHAQKKQIDPDSVRTTWSSVGSGNISMDGSYVSYLLYNQPAGTSKLVLESVNGNWKKVFEGNYYPRFTNDSRSVVFAMGIDSLCLVILGTDEVKYIPHANRFEIPAGGNWVIYRNPDSSEKVTLQNVSDRSEISLSHVVQYRFSLDGNTLLLDMTKDSTEEILLLKDLAGGMDREIWSGAHESIGSLAFDKSFRQIAFIVDEKNEASLSKSIWYYGQEMNSAVKLVDGNSNGIEPVLSIVGDLQFSIDGKKIFFRLKRAIESGPDPKPGMAKVDVWSYMDTVLYSAQGNDAISRPSKGVYDAVVLIQEKRVIRLTGENEMVISKLNPDYAFVRNCMVGSTVNQFESPWNRLARASYWLVSEKDGSRKLLFSGIRNPYEEPRVSPEGKWLIWYNHGRKNFFSYELSNGVIRNITSHCKTSWESEKKEEPAFALARSSFNWLPGDKKLFINDNSDVWLVDPSAKTPPQNITQGYGKKYHYEFDILSLNDSFLNSGKGTAILTATDRVNNDRGFYTANMYRQAAPHKIIMAPYIFNSWIYDLFGSIYELPLKAEKANTWLVTRMSATEAPNFFATKDFQHFKQLSDVQPQKDYTWLTTELVHWKTFSGNTGEGILYKPEDFDRHKKYPVIFNYYEQCSEALNLFIAPFRENGNINIPLMVSRGYLVFAPDIHYKIGYPGASAYDYIVSAAHYLSQKPWVDSKHMGIEGHSFGGYETDYIITHSHVFAAACSASGIENLVSFYGSDLRDYPKYWAESQQGRIGATPWQRPDLYISNSPIFKADKITTPLLMMNNKADGTVPFAQGVELFTALRRLGKRVWMLQYDGDGHTIDFRSPNIVDFNTRMNQFFDHYLKSYPAPVWMTRGIRAVDKGIIDGFELDTKIKTPGPGLVDDIVK